MARTGKGWSGPSSIATGGAGFGFQIGASETEFIFILNTRERRGGIRSWRKRAIRRRYKRGCRSCGRTAEADVTPVAAVYAYSRSQGLFAGVSLEGTVIAARDDTNAEYYGRSVTPGQILSGKVKVPAGPGSFKRRWRGTNEFGRP